MSKLEKLFLYYERELARLRQEMLRFEHTHPQVAPRLATPDGQTDLLPALIGLLASGGRSGVMQASFGPNGLLIVNTSSLS